MNGWGTVVLLGRTNAGKSTLFNRLIGKRRNIVHNEPGVTRDFLEGLVQNDDSCFHLIDTAGFELGPGSYPEVQKGLRRSFGEADLFLYVIDGKEEVNPVDYEALRDLLKLKKPLILAINKVDHAKHEWGAYRFHELGLSPLYFISAEHGLGIGDLLVAVQEKISLALPLPPTGTSFGREGSPTKIVIVGRPNVGKSSLSNLLSGRERMVVSARPGTTRDAVEIPITVGKKSYLLLDTAGIRRAGKRETRVERASVSQSIEGIHEAAVVVWMIDADEGIVEQDKRVLSEILALKKPFVVLFNKWDLVKTKGRKLAPSQLEKKWRKLFLDECPFVPYAPLVFGSAKGDLDKEALFKWVGILDAEAHHRLETSALNKGLESILLENPPPHKSGKAIRIYYATQTRIAPPTFVFFANRPSSVHFSYRRFLENALRTHFPFTHVPIQIIIRGREKR